VEHTTAHDRYYNYCLYDYKPVASPENKLRPVNLLYDSFRFTRIDSRAYNVVDAIREGIGMHNTVWGIKLVGEEIGWEFYFYDYQRRERERSITKVLDAIRPWLPCRVPVNENDHYFMFSLDVRDDLLSGEKELDEVHMYVGNTASVVSSGICYSLTSGVRKLENFYFFFDPKTQRNDIVAKVVSSAFIDTTVIDLDSILWPELRDCGTICIANKQHNDCAYFSGINVDQFLFFLRRMNYPAPLVSWVEGNRPHLDHLLYDVGIDYRMEGDEVVILKSGYYGIF